MKRNSHDELAGTPLTLTHNVTRHLVTHMTRQQAAMDAKIAQFCQVTGCADPAKARFFLESSNGEIDAAISAFFGASPRLPAAQI